uniref:transmembrane protein 223 isoform X2 n=1 Tax=Pristiophorus japonicus TaxID=55135 RepID=UPI00398ED9AC
MGSRSLIMGTGSLAMGTRSLIVGTGSLVMGTRGLIMGTGSLVMGTRSLAMGTRSLIVGTGSLVMGTRGLIMGTGSLVMGTRSLVMGTRSLIMGSRSLVMGSRSLVLGSRSPVLGSRSLVLGSRSPVLGSWSPVLGSRSLVLGSRSPVLGSRSLVLGSRSLATKAGGLAHTRAAAAIQPVGQLGARGGGRSRGGVAGECVSDTALSSRELCRAAGWTWPGSVPGTARAWGTPGVGRRLHRWSAASPEGLGPPPGTRAVSAAVPQDVLLFHHQRAGFFRLVGLFCAAQFLFWVYLAHFAFTSLKDTGYEETVLVGDRARGLPKIGGLSLNLGSNKWRYGFTISCLTVGSLILTAGCIFSRRSVSRVLLHRGGQRVTITRYQPFGGTGSFSVPLRHVSCAAHRSQSGTAIPIKIPASAVFCFSMRAS